jgi:hypothetical protein
MKTLLNAALVVGILTPVTAFPASKPKQHKQFQADYLKHVNTANAALREFINADCSDLEEKAKVLDDSIHDLHASLKLVPEDEDELVQAFQEELYFGITVLEDDFVTSKLKECHIPLPDVDPASATNSKL